MGVRICLEILPDRIVKDDWKRVYDESLKLLQAYPFVSLKVEEKYALKRLVYSNNLETQDEFGVYWDVCGDSKTKKMAEMFRLHSNLKHYIKAQRNDHHSISDIFFASIKDENNAVAVFGNKTQGEDYHTYILGIAMLIESRLEPFAIVSGDISINQVIKVKKWADEILEQQINLPARVDKNKLWYRLSSQIEGDTLINKFYDLYIGEKSEVIGYVMESSEYRSILEKWLKSKIKKYDNANHLGVIRLLTSWINCDGDISLLCTMLCSDSDGPQFDVEDLVKGLCDTWVMIPQDMVSIFKDTEKLTVSWQFRSIGLDMMFGGRKIEKYIEKNKLIEMLSLHFPGKAQKIKTIVENSYASIINDITKYKEVYNNIEKQNVDIYEVVEVEDAAENYLHYIDGTNLIETLKLVPVMVLLDIKKYIENSDDDDDRELIKSILRLKKAIIDATYDRRIALTEEGWNWIDKEEDIEILFVPFAFLFTYSFSKGFKNVTKAILENRQLCKEISCWMKDEMLVKKIMRMVQDLSEQKDNVKM